MSQVYRYMKGPHATHSSTASSLGCYLECLALRRWLWFECQERLVCEAVRYCSASRWGCR